jgi:hypothetical protein
LCTYPKQFGQLAETLQASGVLMLSPPTGDLEKLPSVQTLPGRGQDNRPAAVAWVR